MRAFWVILVALAAAGGAYVFVFVQASTAGTATTAQLTSARHEADGALQANAAREQPIISKDEAPKPDGPVTTSKPSAPAADQPKAAAPIAPSVDQPKVEVPKEAPAAKPEPAKPDPAKPDPAPAPKQADTPKAGGFAISGASVAPAGVTGAPTTGAPKPVVATVKLDKPPTFLGFEVIPAKIEKKDDGSMLVDGQYLIKGEGTAEKPYIVPWEVLTSVEETFDPQAAKKRLPERVTMLDGKIVKLSGYVAFPLMMKEAKECLSMLNQWDGCCIGVPPTPYDAVEVSLTRTIKGEERFTTSGAVVGTFKVKPYLQGDWLIGLYVMERGDLKSKDYSGAAGS